MDKNIDDLFRLVQEYNPQKVGVEVTGQQKGFIAWIQQEMLSRNIFFTLAQDSNSREMGLKPNTNKFERFNVVVPLFKMHKVWFPEEMKDHPAMREMVDELTLAAIERFKSKHDDFIDTISMLAVMGAWKPSQVSTKPREGDKYWDDWDPEPEEGNLENYLV